MNLDLIAECIRYISIPGGEVSDPDHIKEFVLNTDKNTIKLIRDKLMVLSDSGITKDFEVKCVNEECGHEWKTPMVFDPSHFFV